MTTALLRSGGRRLFAPERVASATWLGSTPFRASGAAEAPAGRVVRRLVRFLIAKSEGCEMIMGPVVSPRVTQLPPPSQPPYPQQGGYQQPQQGYPSQQPYPAAPTIVAAPEPTGPTNGLAIASVIFAFLFWPLGLILGIVAQRQTRKTGQKGHSLARTGTILSVLVPVLGAALVVAIVGNLGTKTVTALKPGDCVTSLEVSDNVTNLPVTDCAQAHEGEVYFVFDLPKGDYPGDDKVQKQSEDRCAKEINTYAGAGADEKFDIFYLRPSPDDWSRDRGVTCIATDAKKQTTGSIKK